MVLMLAPSIVVSALYAYTTEFKKFILDAVLVIAITFFGTLIAAMILPWRKKELYENSPIARYKIAGIPAITIGGGGIGTGAHALNEAFDTKDSWLGTERALLLAVALAR